MKLNALYRLARSLVPVAGMTLLIIPACDAQTPALPTASREIVPVAAPHADTSPATRQVATPPSLDSAAAVLSWNSGTGDLSWYYTNPGDYNQDGSVTVSDITPLGQNFGAAGPFPMDTALSVVDGNSDGFITVSDITPLGQNFGNSLVRYEAYHSADSADCPAGNTDPNGAGAVLLGTLELAANPLVAGQRRAFVLHPAAPPATGYGWVRPISNGDAPGTPSPLISFGNPGGNIPPDAQLTALPTAGAAPLTVSFDASGSTDSDGQIIQYSWDFDGDLSTDLAGAAAVAQYTYTAGGQFTAGVRVLDDAGGQDSTSIQITVGGSAGQPPVASLLLIPENAAPGDTVVLHSVGSYDPDGGSLHYSFDPEGDGSFRPPDTDISLNWTYKELGDFTPALRVIDEDGQFADASGNLEVSLGELEKHVIDQQMGSVPSGQNVGLIIAGGKPAVAYYDPSAELGLCLRWRGALDEAGATWADQRALSQGTGTFSLGLAHGTPGIAYVRDFNIYYTRADTADGSGAWSIDRLIIDGSTVSDEGFVSQPSLATINGNPAVLCNNNDALFGGDLAYIRSTYPTGSNWPALGHQIANNDTYVAFGSALAEIGGRPATAFVGGFWGTQHIKYMRSYDAEGISWTLTPTDLTPAGAYRISDTSLGVVFGNPAVAWHNYGDDRIEYARALDANGVQWGDPVIISDVTNTQADIDLTVINSLPWVAYCDHATGLYCAVAKDFYGNEWNTPVLVDSGVNVGKAVKLVEIDGRGALAYYNPGRQNVEFAVFRDPAE